jgi:hypothetical protein
MHQIINEYLINNKTFTKIVNNNNYIHIEISITYL